MFAGEVGKHFFPLTRSPASTGHTKCMRWHQAEKDKLSDINLRLRETLLCPCDLPLLIADGRWKFDWKNYVARPRRIRLCYYERQPSKQSSQVRYSLDRTNQLITNMLNFDNFQFYPILFVSLRRSDLRWFLPRLVTCPSFILDGRWLVSSSARHLPNCHIGRETAQNDKKVRTL